MASVRRIWTTPEGSAPMESVDSIRAVEGGLEGDRYLTGEGYYSPFDVCEVTFLAHESLVEIRESTGIDLTDGRHRRNVVTEGVDVHDLLEARFRVGGAVFEGTRPRPPCAHVEAIAGEEGVTRALAEGRGGICADVVEPGAFAVGDAVEVLESTAADWDGLASEIRERAGR
ncbi:MAG: MOSC domain-containing protein [Haloarculaceae archaeon]